MCSYAFYVFAVLFVGAHARAFKDTVEVGNNTAECADQMIKWCDDQSYPEEGAGMTMVSNFIRSPKGSYRVLCISDSEGTNCTQNGQQWISCTPDHKFYFKGELLTSENADKVDDDICTTADMVFNDLFLQSDMRNFTTDLTSELEKGFRSFFEQMMEMQEQINQLTNMFGDDGWFKKRSEPSYYTGVVESKKK